MRVGGQAGCGSRWKLASAGIAAAVCLAGLCLPATARAAERLTLANGFDLLCDHHALVDGHVRVYMKHEDGGPDEADYVELKPEAIMQVEVVPDAPAPAAVKDAGQAVSAAVAASVSDQPLTAGDLHQLLLRPSAEHNVDEDLLASIVKAESGGRARAVSRTGARGLMQLMPGTAEQMGVADSFAPELNVRGGTAYFDGLLTRYHDNIALALAAYNAGPEAVDRYHGIPPYAETRAYVARVIHEFNHRVASRTALRGRTGQQTVAAASLGTR